MKLNVPLKMLSTEVPFRAWKVPVKVVAALAVSATSNRSLRADLSMKRKTSEPKVKPKPYRKINVSKFAQGSKAEERLTR